MLSFPRAIVTLVVLVLFAGVAPAASQKEIDTAIERGVAYLKSRFKNGTGGGGGGAENYGIGPTALAGIALLEAKVPAGDPTIQAMATTIREAAYRETRTYQISLCLIFLDCLENPADVPLIQILAVRLVAGQNPMGGWTYTCIKSVPGDHEQRLRAAVKSSELVAGSGDPKAPGPSGGGAGKHVAKLHPEIEKYSATLMAARVNDTNIDDNSNTQFAVLAVWAGRKHGVPVEAALDQIERRFLTTQNASGGWSYQGGIADNTGGGSAAMNCAGLIGLSVGIGRREETRLRAEQARKDKEAAAHPAKPNDPFFNPPPKPDSPDGNKSRPKHVPDAKDAAVNRGLGAVGAHLSGRGPPTMGGDEYYLLWSVERVGVLYGLEKIGGVDWYAVGAETLVRKQGSDGSWGGGVLGSHGPDVSTSFAILFLTRANIARDLSSKIKPGGTELRAGAGPGAPVAPSNTTTTKPATPDLNPGPGPLPTPVADEASRLAANLVAVPGAEWSKALTKVRDAKGGDYTKALAVAIPRLEGDRKKDAREALSERLTRMTANTLRELMKGNDAELRRAAALAAAMKDDKTHVPDLVDRLTDDEESVVRAAKAGLKSLTGQDFGPASGASKAERKVAADDWRAWWAKQKK